MTKEMTAYKSSDEQIIERLMKAQELEVELDKFLMSSTIEEQKRKIAENLSKGAIAGSRRILQATQSKNEKIALDASIYAINQLLGSPVAKSININKNYNIDNALD